MTNNQSISYAVLAMKYIGLNRDIIVQVSDSIYDHMDRYTEQEAEKLAHAFLSEDDQRN